jgi:2-oxoglutarate ferredoxin oxidoreductase subunit alpha
MIQDCTWGIGGEAGFGINAAGFMLAKACSRNGYGIVGSNEYPSLIRGGHNFISLRISTGEIFAPKASVDILVALNKETVALHTKQLAHDALVLYDPKDYEWKKEEVGTGVTLVAIPFSELVKKLEGDTVMRNTIALGATMVFLGKDLSFLTSVIKDMFAKKGEAVIAENIRIAEEGYNYAKANFGAVASHVLAPGEIKDPKLIMNVSEAVGLGAIAGGMKFAAIYPMTPINALIPLFTDNAKKFNIVYKQPEDEIAGINMAVGASLAGARSMVATSGGGFALMEEAVSMTGIMEVPLVIDLGMRPGPATGMPTWTEQGELHMAIYAGHGEFPRIVLAPGDVEEGYTLTKKAFDLADEFQIPVFVLTDKYLNESQWQISADIVKDMGQAASTTTVNAVDLKETPVFKRYSVNTQTGVSVRSLPGMKFGEYIANSYEHEEDGYTTEDAGVRVAQVDKRLKKAQAILQKAMKPIVTGTDTADITFVSFGSLKGVIREAVKELMKNGKSVRHIHFAWVYPMPADVGETLAKEKRLICIEQNATGQLASVIKEATGITMKEVWRKYDGRQWTSEEILEKVKG